MFFHRQLVNQTVVLPYQGTHQPRNEVEMCLFKHAGEATGTYAK